MVGGHQGVKYLPVLLTQQRCIGWLQHSTLLAWSESYHGGPHFSAVSFSPGSRHKEAVYRILGFISQMRQVSVSRKHLDYLDGLRASAALVVVLHHTWLQAGLPTYIFGHDAVGLFIVISGFCLTLPIITAGGILPSGALSFFKRRARRILPPYYLAMILSLVLIWFFLGQQPQGYYDESFDVNFEGIFTHLFLIHDIFISTATQINGPFWSIAVEWRIYFLFPVFVLLFRHWGALKTLILAFITSLILSFILLHTSVNMDTHGVSPQYIALFTMGMFAAMIVYTDQGYFAMMYIRTPWHILVILLGLILIVHGFVPLWHGNIVPHYISDYVVGLWSASLLIAASQPKTLLNTAFSWKPLVFIGTFAYSIYLLHFSLLRLFWQYLLLPFNLSTWTTFALLIIIVVPIIIGLCYLFFLIAERPFLSQKQKKKINSSLQQSI